MTDVLPALLLDTHVQGVDRARVIVRQPGGKDPVAAQLAAVLVRMNIVGIVRARAVILELTDVLSLFEAAG